MEDKIVEIARFYEPEAAQMIESLLKSEGIKCYLRNEYTSQSCTSQYGWHSH